MNMMDSIASMATEMRAAQLAMSYSVGVMEKTMDAQEDVLLGLMEMLPPNPPPTDAQFIDIYA